MLFAVETFKSYFIIVDFKLIKPDTHLKFVDMDLLGLNG